MNHDRTYRLLRPVPAPLLQDADDPMRQVPRRSAGSARYAETHPVPPLKGLRETRTASVSYWALTPDWAGLPFRITATHPVLHQSILNSEFLILNWTYSFSAKEKDSETGLSYFGSRYYSSDLSVWLSVDPMADKYPSMSPYVYCANNPVKLTDPDGRWIPGLDEDGNVTYTAEKGDNYRTFADQFYCYKKGKDNKLQDKSLEIFENAGYKGGEHAVVKEGDVITGKAVYDAMGSDVLKGDWSNMTDNQKAYQIKFAFDYGKKNNSSIGQDFAINLNDFFHGFSTGYSAMELNGVNIPIREGGSVIMTTVNITIWPKDRLVNRNGQIPIYWRSQATGENYRMHNYYSAINSSAGGKIPAITISF